MKSKGEEDEMLMMMKMEEEDEEEKEGYDELGDLLNDEDIDLLINNEPCKIILIS